MVLTCCGSAVVQWSSPSAAAASDVVTGFVFQDFDSDGTYDSTSTFGQAQDIPLAGVSVRAFDETGSRVGTTRTTANGTYLLDFSDSGVTEVRIEFVWPSTFPFSSMRPSFVGPDNGGSIQFVSVGASNINFALNTPEDYCQSNPNICVTRQVWMNNTTSVPVSPSIYVSGYNSGPLNSASSSTGWFVDWARTKAAQFNLTGSVHGVAWDAVSRRIYTSAYVRRGVALYESPAGTPRPAAVFVTTPTGVTAAEGFGGTTSFLVDLETLLAGDQFSNLTAPASGVANAGFTGYIPSNSARGVSLTAVVNSSRTDSDIPSTQDGVYEEVGRTGIGDIDTDSVGNLWVVSLYTRELYKVTLNPDGTAPTVMTSAGSIVSGVDCTNGVARPHGLTSWRGGLFVGVVCDGSAGYDPAKPNDVNATKNLTFTIRKYDTATGTWSTFFGPQPLYALNDAGLVQPFKGAPSGATNTTSDKNIWNPWTTLYSTSWGPGVAHPMPILSDIEFDRDGSMILGFRDLMKDALVNLGWTNPAGGSEQNMVAPGDIYRVCRTGSGYTPADYVFEGGPGCTETGTNQTTNTFDDEFYDDSYGPPTAGHLDISSGMTEQVPGFPDVLFTVFDPFDTNSTGSRTWSSGGVKYLSNTTGAGVAVTGHPAPTGGPPSGVIYVSSPDGGLATNAGSFAKSNAMSDIEALCDQAPVQIGNRVWNDADGDGIQDPGEDPIPGVTVHLYDSSGVLVGTSVTDANGNYYFTSTTTESAAGNGDNVGGGLTPTGDFTLKLDNPADYGAGGPLEYLTVAPADVTTTEPTDTEDSLDSDASLTGTGTDLGVDSFPTIAVPAQGAGNNNQTFDFGFAPPAAAVSVGGTAGVDADKDGQFEAGEPVLPGVEMTLTDTSGNPVTDVYGNVVGPVTTDENGNYVFENLPPGQYRVTPTMPEGYVVTDPESGYGTSEPLTVDGQSDMTLDFLAIQPAVSVGDLVWNDLDGDGVQDVGEPGLPGVEVGITRSDGTAVTDIFGNPVTSTVTDENGNYVFDNLPPGQYTVSVSPPAGFLPTVSGAGTPTTDSATGSATSGNLTTDGDSDTSLDFGFVAEPVAIGDRVWMDVDNDGIQDAGEPGIAGVVLSVRNLDGSPVLIDGVPIPDVTTDENGNYVFTDLPYGVAYEVRVVSVPDGFVPSPAGAGNDPELDSSSGSAISGVVSPGDPVDLSLDFGFVPVVSVGDLVWADTDRDGIQDAGEPGIAGVTLSITNLDGSPVTDVFGEPVTTTTTDADGNYLFENLPVGRYVVSVQTPSGYVPTASTGGAGADDSSTGQAVSANLAANGDADTTLDFGFVVPAVSVGQTVWFDIDRDGIQDAGEPGIAGVTLSITKADGSPVTDVYGNPVTTTVTDENGNYLFEDLPPGEYTVTATPPEGYLATVSDSATSVNLQTDGANDSTLDFGFYPPMVSVGDLVWFDLDNDGIQDDGEPGLEGVTLSITKADGSPVTDVYGNPVTTTVTDANGNYVFENLPLGRYTVTATTPSGFVATVSSGGTGTDDSSTGSATSADLQVDGADDPTLDFGFWAPPATVGSRVWVDLDNDGIQDAGEAGLAGVVLSLRNLDGSPVFIDGVEVPDVTTDANGNYVFTDLPLDVAYMVTVVSVPDGYVPSPPGVGTDRELDSSTGTAISEVLDAADLIDFSLDFGFVPKVSVGDLVWVDSDRDGIQDAGEAGLEGVVLSITNADGSPVIDVYGNVVEPVTTDANGNYLFENLPVGQYVVTATTPAGYEPTLTGVDDPSPDRSTSTATSVVFTTGGTQDMTLDFGYIVPAVSVGDLVWWDTDRDGVQDAGEPGIAGVTLTITAADGSPVTDVYGNPVTTTMTDENGNYLFEDLPPGEYMVTVTPPAGYVATVSTGGTEDDDSSTGSATSVSLPFDGDSDPTLDFGFHPPAVSVGDLVWRDTDRDGVQDAGEPGIAGVTLTITKADGSPVTDVYGNPVTTTMTDENGNYLFEDLPPGEYTVTVTPPAGYVTTTAPTGTSADLLVDAESDLTLVFGLAEPAVSVGDLVWRDTDRDGIQDEGEPGLEGVVLSITKADGSPVTNVFGEPVTTTVTDANGNYLFENLPAGSYVVRVQTPTGHVATASTGGAGDDDSSTGQATSADLQTDGDSDPTLDFGFVEPAVSVGDLVWWDTDRDGVQDAGEPGIAGVTLSITRSDGSPVTDVYGNPVTTTVTDENGNYLFEDLPPGEYMVTVIPPAGYVATVSAGGTGDDDSSTGSATSADLQADGASDSTLDFGFYAPAVSVGDLVWFDTDRDGIQDAGEPGIAGVTLTITKADGSPVTNVYGNPVTTTVTDENGRYLFEDLPPGEYTVTVTPPEGYTATVPGAGDGESDSSTGSATSVNLQTDGESDPTLDFGFYAPAVSVGDLVWFDTDRDGIQDADEPGIAGVTLTITKADGSPVTDVYGNPVTTTVTDENGNYLFEDLPPGEYTVTVTPPAGYTATTPSTETSVDLLVDGESDLTLMFGLAQLEVSVGDLVWLDTDRDGVQDAGEPGIAGVTLSITNMDGSPVTNVFGEPVTTTVTDENGNYLFENLPAGSYVVRVQAPDGYVATASTGGAGDDDSSTGQATSADLQTDGASDPTLDFGFVEPAVSVGDLVWFDTDRDGVQDAGELGIAGVTLTIARSDGSPVTDVYGEPVTTTVTDENGRYLFENLPPGEYTVTVTPPEGYTATVPGAGDGESDSSTGSATSADLQTDGESDPTLDFGFTAPMVSVGDLVWLDTDRDGVQDAGEPGIAGVRLTITKTDGSPVTDVYGNPVTTTVTDANGNYLFENLPVGRYVVTVTPPSGHRATVAGSGDAGSDSSSGSATSTDLQVDGAADPTLDFGFVPSVTPSVSVGDRVWRDTNGDGRQGAKEKGVPGVTLRLFDANGRPVRDVYGRPVGPRVTDARGRYSFDNLPPGQYTVKITYPRGFRPTTANRPNREINSSSHVARSLVLRAGQRDASLDFGIVRLWRKGLAPTL